MYIYIIWGCKDFPEHKKKGKKRTQRLIKVTVYIVTSLN